MYDTQPATVWSPATRNPHPPSVKIIYICKKIPAIETKGPCFFSSISHYLLAAQRAYRNGRFDPQVVLTLRWRSHQLLRFVQAKGGTMMCHRHVSDFRLQYWLLPVVRVPHMAHVTRHLHGKTTIKASVAAAGAAVYAAVRSFKHIYHLLLPPLLVTVELHTVFNSFSPLF